MINYLLKVKTKIMNLTQELIKVYNMLGLKFSSEEKFATVKLKEGDVTITNNMDEEFKVGQELYVVGEGSELSIAPAGQHTTSEGLVLEVSEEGKIVSMMQETVEAPADEVGKAEEEVKTESEEMASEVVEETVEEKEVVKEEEKEDVSETDKIKEDMAVLKEAMTELLSYLKNRDMEMESNFSTLKSDFESFKKSPSSSPVNEVKSVSQSFQDWRLEQLKKMNF